MCKYPPAAGSSSGSPRSGDHLADRSAIVDFFDKVKKGRRQSSAAIRPKPHVFPDPISGG